MFDCGSSVSSSPSSSEDESRDAQQSSLSLLKTAYSSAAEESSEDDGSDTTEEQESTDSESEEDAECSVTSTQSCPAIQFGSRKRPLVASPMRVKRARLHSPRVPPPLPITQTVEDEEEKVCSKLPEMLKPRTPPLPSTEPPSESWTGSCESPESDGSSCADLFESSFEASAGQAEARQELPPSTGWWGYLASFF